MKFLLFLLGVVFFFIFYLFSGITGIEGFFVINLFWIANIYVFITLIIIVMLFLSRSEKNNNEGDEIIDDNKINLYPSLDDLGVFVKNIFSYYIYYIACVLFYGAFYLILKSFYVDASITLLFLVLNIIVIFLYFIEDKIIAFQDFVRVNLVLISLYYIIIHSYYLLGFQYNFSLLDFGNVFGVFFLFGILLYSKRSMKYYYILRHYFVVFTFIELATLTQVVLSSNTLSLGIIAGIGGSSFLIFTQEINNISSLPKGIIRFWGVMFLVIFTIISLFYIGKEDIWALLLIPSLIFTSQLLFLFHKKFQNYAALSASVIGFIGAGYGAYSIMLGEFAEKYYISFLLFFFSAVMLFVDKIYKEYTLYDRYFFHSLSLLVNLLGCICFLYFREFSILSLGLLLLGESIYLFFSYYSLSKAKKIG